jgi:iron complex transport system ATP-binding protein
MSEAPILQVHGARFAYRAGAAPALDAIDFSVPAGKVTALLGPNGAGKTTLLQLLLGLREPQGGLVSLAGRPLRAYSRRERARWMGLVPQRETLTFDYSALEYILLGRAPFLGALEMPGPQDVAVARAALERLEIPPLAGRAITGLSGGELQLVLLARALAQQPRILLLDEPTSHLDLPHKYRLLRILRQLAEDGVTVLFTTHDPDTVSAVDWLVLMRAGRVLESGTIAETFTAEKLSRAYGIPLRVERVDGRWVVLEQK